MMTPERLKALGFFLMAALGDPEASWQCDHTLKHTVAWLQANEGTQEELDYIQDQGGYCDCEVILNIIVPMDDFRDN